MLNPRHFRHKDAVDVYYVEVGCPDALHTTIRGSREVSTHYTPYTSALRPELVAAIQRGQRLVITDTGHAGGIVWHITYVDVYEVP